MYRITTRDLILSVANQWRNQYQGTHLWKEKPLDCGMFGKDIWAILNSLDLRLATREEVNSIIDNPSWTDIICSQCESEVDNAIVFESLSGIKLKVCEECLKNALIILKGKL